MKLLSSVTFAALAGIANARAVLPDCDCDNFVNGLTTDDIGKSACVREQTVGVQGNKRVCYPEKYAYHPGVDQGCPSGTYRCQVSFAPPKFPTCECGSFANLNENGKAPGTTNAAIEAKIGLKRAELEGFGLDGVPFKQNLAAASNTVQQADVGLPIVDELELVNVNEVESFALSENLNTGGFAVAEASVAALGGGLSGAPEAIGVNEFDLTDQRDDDDSSDGNELAFAGTIVTTDIERRTGFFGGRSQEGSVENLAAAVTVVEDTEDNPTLEVNEAVAINNFQGASQGDTVPFLGLPLPATNEGFQKSASAALTFDLKETFDTDGNFQTVQFTNNVAGGFAEAPAPNDPLGLAGGTVETNAFAEEIQQGAVIDQLAGASAVSFTEGQPDQFETGAAAFAGREFFKADFGRGFFGDGPKPEIFTPAAAFNGGPLGGLCVKESQHDVCFPTYKFEQKVGGAEYYGCPEETHRCDVPPAIELSETTECQGGESSSFTFTAKLALSGFSELGSPTYSATSISIAFAARTNVERPDRGFFFTGAKDAYIVSAFCSDSNYFLPAEDFGINLYYDKETCDGHSAWVVDIPALDFLVNPDSPSGASWRRNLDFADGDTFADEPPPCRLKTAEFKSDVWPLPPMGDEDWNAGYPFVCDATLVKDPYFDGENLAGFTFARGTRKIDLKPIHSIPLGSVCGKDGLTFAEASAEGSSTGTLPIDPFQVLDAAESGDFEDFGRRKLGEMPAADRRRKMTDDVEKVKAAIKACAGA